MKYVSYILSIVWIVLLFNIFLSYSSTSYRAFLKDSKSKMMWVSTEEVIKKMNKEQLEVNIKILNSIDKLNENLDILSKKQSLNYAQTNSWETSNFTETDSWNITLSSTWNIVNSKPISLELPWILVTKLMPGINPRKVENNWLFWIKNNKTLESVIYSTYYDEKKRVRIFVLNKSYNDILTLMKWVHSFKINESDIFFGYTFYLNSIKKDTKNRFVTLFEWVSVWFEVENTSYDLLKKSLLN